MCVALMLAFWVMCHYALKKNFTGELINWVIVGLQSYTSDLAEIA